MISFKLNRQNLHARPGQTILQVAKKQGVDIPTICQLPGLEARSVCRICSVEVKGHDRLMPACSTLIEHNMEVDTHSQKSVHARKVLMEFIIAEHGGLESLSPQVQSYAAQLGVSQAHFYLQHQKDADCNRYSSDYIQISQEKCILCDRCISACRDQQVISRAKRGTATLLTFGEQNRPLAETACTSCGDCVAVCPTGALDEYGQ
jgi:predicted molibdopterin-dependent oxidoreductase YjgC